ncbi:glutamate--tRNA ligase family protein [Terrimonas sp. NA20]|uniref:Glutamate--tRNA ligase family protein n=1 Tax=Terrimonas ginsenosidimutans TaxID=2908004 RepID=A0ABS9KTW5_9BACT|nr:glutamate--tRNA ligase family protein [Terrimonas ginsenosidimutans]MCG2615777.1 glutamate--tRNA ligase family protein [Terrimonas ginsenosidimutans]
MVYRQTRLAPTPSGFLHLGNVLSFAVTAYLARRSGAGILLRIDDMDRERVQPGYIQDVFDTLAYLDIPFDKGPVNAASFEVSFSQRQRMSLYEKALSELRSMNALFACTCSRTQLASDGIDSIYPGTCRHKNIPLDTPGAAWRLYTDERPLTIIGVSGDQISQQLPKNMYDFIVRKRDGYPAYQLTSLMDDLFWKVDLIVRGADLLPSTLAQLFLAQIMNRPAFSETHFFHHLLLSSSDGQKFSKSAGATSINFLRNEGRTSKDIFSLIGEKAGFKGITDWRALGQAVTGL